MNIQKPTIGRVVEFHPHDAERKEPNGDRVITISVYPALITQVHDDGVVDLVTFGPNSVYFQHSIAHDNDAGGNTWRYPPRCSDSIDVPC